MASGARPAAISSVRASGPLDLHHAARAVVRASRLRDIPTGVANAACRRQPVIVGFMGVAALCPYFVVRSPAHDLARQVLAHGRL